MRFMQQALILTALSLSMVAVSGALANSASAEAQTFTIDDAGGSQIQFVSDAPLERITGTASKISGTVQVDPTEPAKGKADIKVEVASIRTNLELRDEHLQSESWLDAKRFPNAQFVITKVTGADKLVANEAVEVTVTGKFTLHGVSKDVTTKAKVRWVPAPAGGKHTLRIQTTFMVKFEDHKVSIPTMVSLKVSPEVQVNVDLRASAP